MTHPHKVMNTYPGLFMPLVAAIALDKLHR